MPEIGFGASIATGGDFDGNRTLDLIVAAPFVNAASGADAGRVYVYQAGASAPFATLDGPYAGAEFGVGLAFVGNTSPPLDLETEFVVGYRDAASFFDGFASVHEWNGTGPALRYTVGGVGMGFELMGDRIDGGGNVNGDGFHDFLVGDMFHREVDVFSGEDGTLLRTLDGAGESGFGAARFLLDAQGDGHSDIVVGAWQSDAGATRSGRVFVYSGVDGALLTTITPTTPQVRLGIDVRMHGDHNGDGRHDLLVGAYGQGFGGSHPGAALVFSGHVPAPQNIVRPARLATDPVLADVGGDPTAGPIAGSTIEVFNASLDCSNAPQSGPFWIRVRRTPFAAPVPTGFGWAWVGGPLIFQVTGFQTRNVVTCAPNGIAIPNDFGLFGLVYGVQGACGGRLSSALVQTIGQ